MPQSKQDHLHQAFQRILAEAVPDTPSGSHKTIIVGQLVLNIQGDSELRECYRGGEGCQCRREDGSL